MKVLFLVAMWWCWTENGDYTGSEHCIVYKHNVISQWSFRHCLPCNFSVFLRIFFYPTNPSIHVLKRTGYPFCPIQARKLHCVKISEKIIFIKCTLNKIPIVLALGTCFKASRHFLHYCFSCPTPTSYKSYISYMYHLWSYLMQTKSMDTRSFNSFVYTTNYLYQFG